MARFQLKDHQKGMIWMIFALFCFSLLNATIKGTAPRYPINEILFFRFVFSLIPLGFILHKSEGKAGFMIKRPTFQILRAGIGTCGLALLFYAFGHMPLADSMAISFSTTLFAILFARPLLKEIPTARHLAATFLGFAGVLFVAKPTGNVWSLAALCGICGAAVDSAVLTTGRKLSLSHVSPEQNSFYFSLVATALSGISLFFSGVIPLIEDWPFLFFLGFGGGVAQYAITKGFALAPAAVAAPMIYTASLWSILFGYLFWDEIPSETTLFGLSLIIAAGLYIGYLQTKKTTAM